MGKDKKKKKKAHVPMRSLDYVIQDLWSCEEIIREQNLEGVIDSNFIECMY